MDDPSPLEAIHDIAEYALQDANPKEMEAALDLIESICRHGTLVWSEDEQRKYRPDA